jgi:hypothetical protein
MLGKGTYAPWTSIALDILKVVLVEIDRSVKKRAAAMLSEMMNNILVKNVTVKPYFSLIFLFEPS